MRILVSGSTGLVGSDLVSTLKTAGSSVVRLVRRAGAPGETVSWDPAAGKLDAADLEGFDAVVHLAGESIAAARWSAAQKAKIRDSRVVGTRLLCETLARLSAPPKVLVSASAIGLYGDRGTEVLDEKSAPGKGFLADVCREWEAATQAAEQKGIRTVHCRFGMILSPRGGGLAKMLTPFKMGVGGVLGSGKQIVSWIALDDVIGALQHAIANSGIVGPLNVTAPRPVTNAEFTKTLGRVLGRPTIMPMPAFAARLAFGEMADELLLSSTHAAPQVLQATGYTFRFPELESALRHLLSK